jgi:hypothetical protein
MTGTGLVKWQHPTMGEITFQDVRPGVKTIEPDNDTLAAFDIISKAFAETPGHEGRHAAVAMLFDRKTVEARSAFPDEDGVLGYVQFDFEGERWDRLRLAEQAVILLAGPIAEKTGPPAWPPRSDDGMKGYNSDEKELAHIVQRLNLTEQQYAALVDLTRTITRHPGIKRVEERISTMLGLGVTLNRKQLEDIHDSAWREFTEENRPRTQDELDDAELREQHRHWMTGVLEAGLEYAEEQAKEKAASDLRRECDQLAAEFEQSKATTGQRGAMRASAFPATFTTH